MNERKGKGNKSECLIGLRYPPEKRLFIEIPVNGNGEYNCSGEQGDLKDYWGVGISRPRTFLFFFGGGQNR